MARTLQVEIVGDASALEKAFGRAGKSSSTFGDKVSKGAKIAGAAIGGGLAIAAKIGFDEFKQGQLVAAQTGAVLKSTGGVANVTAGQVDKLSEALMKKSGVDDEAIASGQNMLLTFSNIRNEVGAGNDVFTQATKTLLDMSVATGKAMPQSAVMLGKALNDPLKGLSKLTKIGVTFTDAQKKSIKAMVAHGDTAGAQKVILAELNREFGGSAEAAGKTLPGQINILKESFSNFAGELVAKVIPKVVAIIKFFREHTTVAKVLGGAIAATVGILLAAGAAMKVYAAVTAVVRAATIAWTAAQWLLNAALIANPIGLVVVGLVALGVAFVVAYKKVDAFREVVDSVFGWVKENWPLILGILTGPVGLAVVLIVRHFDEIKSKITGFFGGIFEAAKGYGSRIKDGVVGGVTGVAGAVWDKVAGIGRAIANAVSTIAGWGKSVGSAVKSGAVSGITGIASAVWDVVNNIGSAIANAAKTVIGWGKDLGGWIKDGAVDALKGLGSAIVSNVKAAINALIRRVNSLLELSFTVDLPNKIPGLPNAIKLSVNPPDIPTLAFGGIAKAGLPHLVGERGPELFVPGRTGAVLPMAGRGGVTVNLTMPNYLGNPRDVAVAVREEFVRMQRRGAKLGFG